MKPFLGYQRGINLGGWFSQCVHTQAHYDSFITAQDFAEIASWGLDHVRLPIDYNLLETAEGARIEEGYARLRRAVQWCRTRGLNLIIDLHKTAGYSFDDGEQENGFFGSEALQERFYRLWESLASEYGNVGDSIAFELLNEVTDQAYSDKWNEIAAACVARIRAIAPEVRILLGGYWNNSIHALPDLLLPPDENIVYNFHCYDPLLFTHQGAPWVKGMPHDMRTAFPSSAEEYRSLLGELPADQFMGGAEKEPDSGYFDQAFAEAAELAQQRGVPLYCGEYGVIDRADHESTVAWFEAIHAAFEKYGIGRAAWSYRKMDFGFTDPERADIAERMIAAL